LLRECCVFKGLSIFPELRGCVALKEKDRTPAACYVYSKRPLLARQRRAMCFERLRRICDVELKTVQSLVIITQLATSMILGPRRSFFSKQTSFLKRFGMCFVIFRREYEKPTTLVVP